MENNYRMCPYCGKNQIPFDLKLCICGKSIEKIQYVKNTKNHAVNWYSYCVAKT